MIDRSARNKLAELLRSLAAGLISNDEFEDTMPKSKDKAINEVFFNGGWVLFLKSNYEYSWPNVPFLQRTLHAVTFGLLGTSWASSG